MGRTYGRILIASFLAVVACRAATVWTFGVPFPAGTDNWHVEFFGIYRPYLAGALDWRFFIQLDAPTGHVATVAKLYDFLLFVGRGEKWDPLLQLYLQTVTPALTCAVLIAVMLNDNGGRLTPTILGILCLYAAPVAYRGIISPWGISSSVTALLGFLALRWAARAEVTAPYFCAILAASAVAVLAHAGGFSFMGAVGAAFLIRAAISEIDRPKHVLYAALTLAVCGFLFLALMPFGSAAPALHPRSASDLLLAVGKSLAWPNWPFPWAGAVLLVASAGSLMALTRREGWRRNQNTLMLLFLFVWMVAFAVTVGIARGATDVESAHSRYGDFFLLFPAHFLFCVEALTREHRPNMRTAVAVALLAAIVPYSIENLAHLRGWTDFNRNLMTVAERAISAERQSPGSGAEVMGRSKATVWNALQLAKTPEENAVAVWKVFSAPDFQKIAPVITGTAQPPAQPAKPQ